MFDLHTLLGRRLKSKSVTYETKSVCVEWEQFCYTKHSIIIKYTRTSRESYLMLSNNKTTRRNVLQIEIRDFVNSAAIYFIMFRINIIPLGYDRRSSSVYIGYRGKY